MNKAIQTINLLLTIDFFIVLAAFFWFIISLIGKSLNFPLGFNLWQQLWEPFFMPAISILMAGAIISAIASKINNRLIKKE